MLTKEDYMKLSKEELAELLVERDFVVTIPTDPPYYNPCYAPNGLCTNPQRDCINCPKRGGMSNVITTTETTLLKN